MAQLIKLQDYVSRYEVDMYRYPGQFIRAKKQHWETMTQKWSEQRLGLDDEESNVEEEEKKHQKWKRLFKREKEETTDQFPSHQPPATLEESKQMFLDDIYSFQLTWATATLWEKSFLDPEYRKDLQLKYFLQRFPDTFLVMYNPLVNIKQASMEINTIMIGPLGIEIIHMIEAPEGAVIVPEDNRTWYIEDDNSRTKIISPLIALNRSETYVKSVLSKYGIEFPYKKVILAPENEFKSSHENYHTSYIGKETYPRWFEEKRGLRSPLKHGQLKVAEALVKHSQTTSIKRPEWDQEEEGFMGRE